MFVAWLCRLFSAARWSLTPGVALTGLACIATAGWAGGTAFRKIADMQTVAPPPHSPLSEHDTTFWQLGAPSLDGNRLAFWGLGGAGETRVGIFLAEINPSGSQPPLIYPTADIFTPAPGSIVIGPGARDAYMKATFYPSPQLSGLNTAFVGSCCSPFGGPPGDFFDEPLTGVYLAHGEAGRGQINLEAVADVYGSSDLPFTGFWGGRSVAIDRDAPAGVAFLARQQDVSGVYAEYAGHLHTIANTNTSPPGVSRKFDQFWDVSINSGTVAFVGQSGDSSGLYASDVSGFRLRTLVDSNALVPGTPENFDWFGAPVAGAEAVSFVGSWDTPSGGETEFGYFQYDLAAGKVTPVVSADRNPYGVRPGVDLQLAADNRDVALEGQFGDGRRGVFFARGGDLRYVLGTGSYVGGRMVKDFAFAPSGLSDGRLGLLLWFDGEGDWENAVYLASIGATALENGDFRQLNGWSVIQEFPPRFSESVVLTNSQGNSMAALLEDVALEQNVATPAGPFALDFQYRFTGQQGSLQVYLGNSLIQTLPAPTEVSDQLTSVAVRVDDRSLLGWSDLPMSFRTVGLETDSLLLDNVRLSPILPGDADGDGRIDLADFGILKSNFGGDATPSRGDFDLDGRIDLADFGILKANFGQAVGVPEPATRLLAFLGGTISCAAGARRTLRGRKGGSGPTQLA